MLKTPLVENMERMFLEEGYATCRYRGCFDLAAKKKMLLFLKILKNVDAFSAEQARNLKIISSSLDAKPLLVGAQTRIEKLERGIVYERFDVPAVSEDTLEDLICNEIFPRVYRDRGGLYVEIDSYALKSARNKKGMTQEELAETVGINKKTVYEHENNSLRMLLSVAESLESVLKEKIISDVEIFSERREEHGAPSPGFEKTVSFELKRLGFETEFVRQTPFNAISKQETLILSDVDSDKRKLKYRSVELKRFVSFIKKPALLITEKSENLDYGLPAVERSELREMDSGKELIRVARKKV
ncbi:MAG: helix-turn-helix domain-containing protein [Candidatus Aenigmatarchaeota archaeon]